MICPPNPFWWKFSFGYFSFSKEKQITRSDIDAVIVKPTDSAGSKGVTKVNTPEELEESIKYALSFSHSNEFIIEDFIEKQGCSSDTDSFTVNGELVFCSFSNQHFDESAANPYTPSAYSWPSTMPDEVQAELRSELQRLMTLTGSPVFQRAATATSAVPWRLTPPASWCPT